MDVRVYKMYNEIPSIHPDGILIFVFHFILFVSPIGCEVLVIVFLVCDSLLMLLIDK